MAYSGTHDNDTICGCYQGGGFGDSRKPEEVEAERHRVRVFLSVSGEEIHWDVMRYLLNHKAQCVIFPVQDIAAMGSAARLNVPGTVGEHNWTWRMTWEELPASALEKLKELSLAAGRNQARHR